MASPQLEFRLLGTCFRIRLSGLIAGRHVEPTVFCEFKPAPDDSYALIATLKIAQTQTFVRPESGNPGYKDVFVLSKDGKNEIAMELAFFHLIDLKNYVQQ